MKQHEKLNLAKKINRDMSGGLLGIIANICGAQTLIISYLIEEHNKKKSPAKEPNVPKPRENT
jgi:hypothetical protein